MTSVDDSSERLDGRMLSVLRLVAPGTVLRQGLERILRAETGALIVLGAPTGVQAMFTGGFRIHVPYTMRTVTLYLDEWRHVVDDAGAVLSRANQAVQTLQRYRTRCDEASAALDTAELDGHATLRPVLNLISRCEMVRRVAVEVERYEAELGSDARLLRLQLEDLSAGVEEEQRLAVRDYLRPGRGIEVSDVLEELGRLSPEELFDVPALAKALDLSGNPDAVDVGVVPRGYRLLSRVRGLPASVITRVVERFGSLKVILAAGIEDLEEVEGVGAGRARNLREGLRRLVEASA